MMCPATPSSYPYFPETDISSTLHHHSHLQASGPKSLKACASRNLSHFRSSSLDVNCGGRGGFPTATPVFDMGLPFKESVAVGAMIVTMSCSRMRRKRMSGRQLIVPHLNQSRWLLRRMSMAQARVMIMS